MKTQLLTLLKFQSLSLKGINKMTISGKEERLKFLERRIADLEDTMEYLEDAVKDLIKRGI